MNQPNLNKKLFSDQKGQALVEYILIVLISLAIVITISFKTIEPFRQWASIYLGSYIECLLDEGQLPTLGSGEPAGSCDEEFEPYSFDTGRRQIASGSTSSRSSGSSGNNPPSSNRGGRTAVGSNNARDTGGTSSLSSDASQSNEKKQTLGPDSPDNFLSSRGGQNISRNTSASRTAGQTMSIENLPESARRGLPRTGSKSTGVGTLDPDSDPTGARKTLIIPARDKKKSSFNDEIEPWSFGRIFRIAFIVLIIALLVLLIGLQVQQIQKGMEKSDG